MIGKIREFGFYKPEEKKENIIVGNEWEYIKSGRYYRGKGEFGKAIEMYEKAIQINPGNDPAYVELGMLYNNQNKFEKTEEMLRKAIEINSRKDRLYGSLANCYLEWGKYKLSKKYFRKANKFRLENYNPQTYSNYRKLKELAIQRRIELVCVQYPMCSLEPLKKILEPHEGIIFVDNEMVFKEAVKREGYDEYFEDIFAGDFGHCTHKGNRLLAENIAKVILKKWFNYKR